MSSQKLKHTEASVREWVIARICEVGDVEPSHLKDDMVVPLGIVDHVAMLAILHFGAPIIMNNCNQLPVGDLVQIIQHAVLSTRS